MADQGDIDAITASVTKATTVEKSAEILINGISARITAEVQKALAGGATAEQVAGFKTLAASLSDESDALQTAITANTPAA